MTLRTRSHYQNERSMSSIPSLTNAPKKPTLRRCHMLGLIPKFILPDENRKVPEWKVLYGSGHIREQYLHLTPEDISDIDCLYTLMDLRELYVPSSQPQHLFEEAYLQIMLDAIEAKMNTL